MQAIAITLALTLFTLAAYAADLPDPTLTPGRARVVSKAEVCRRGSSRDARHVTAAMKREVFRRYGIPSGNHTGFCAGPHGCEVDHLISLELGGANAVENLWPQPFDGKWNAHLKDKLENGLNKEICAGTITMKQAQEEIRTNWIEAYKNRFPEP
jgi:hypothetical protein